MPWDVTCKIFLFLGIKKISCTPTPYTHTHRHTHTPSSFPHTRLQPQILSSSRSGHSSPIACAACVCVLV